MLTTDLHDDFEWPLEKLDKSQLLVDIRSEEAFSHGSLPGAIHVPNENVLKADLPMDREIVLLCQSGVISRETAQKMRSCGYKAYSLIGGFDAWLLKLFDEQEAAEDGSLPTLMSLRKERTLSIETSIRKKFHKELFSRFARAVKNYELVQEGDHIAVCISGGKDSMLMAKLFQELRRHQKVHFDLTFLCMDPGYNHLNRRIIEQNAKVLDIPLTVFESQIFDAVYEVEQSPCYLCARMRRGYLYSHAKALGCNKIALGHHFDDVIETTLMGMLYGGQIQGMMPKLHSTHFDGMELIRPMYLIREDDIKRWRDYNGLHFIQCACKFTDTCTTCNDGRTGSKRQEIKRLIAELKKTNPNVEMNIFRSTENVHIDTMIAYKKGGVKHHFLGEYE